MRLRQLLDIQKIDRAHFDTLVDYQVEIVSIYEDIDPEIIYEWDITELNSKFNMVTRVLNSKPESKEEISSGEYIFRKFPFTKLTFGEYIDLEYYVTRENHLLEIILLFYRTYTQGRDIDPIVFEEYGSFTDARKELFMEIDVMDIVGVKHEYLEWRDKLHESYSGLFNQGYDDDEEEEETKNTIGELARRQREKEAKSFTWENIILQLTNNDASKYRDALKMPIIMVFNMLSTFKNNA